MEEAHIQHLASALLGTRTTHTSPSAPSDLREARSCTGGWAEAPVGTGEASSSLPARDAGGGVHTHGTDANSTERARTSRLRRSFGAIGWLSSSGFGHSLATAPSLLVMGAEELVQELHLGVVHGVVLVVLVVILACAGKK